MTKPLNRRSLSMPLMGSDDDTTNYYMVGWSSPTLDIVVFAFSCRPGDLPPVFKCQKMALRVPNKKNGDHFLSPTTPQNGVRHVCFMRLALLGGF